MGVAGNGPKLYKLGPGRNARVGHKPSDLEARAEGTPISRRLSTRRIGVRLALGSERVIRTRIAAGTEIPQ